MFIVPTDQMLFPLITLDVSAFDSSRSTPSVPRPNVTSATRVVQRVRVNVVRLIPGATRLPFERANR
jgi:hypothetical protein